MAVTTLPEPEQSSTPPKPRSFSRWIAWMIVLSLLLLLAALNVMSLTVRDLQLPLEAELSRAEAVLSNTPAPDPNEDALVSTLVHLRSQIAALEPMRTELALKHLDWPTTMQYVANFDPAVMTIRSVSQNEGVITVSGDAQDEAVVIAYADALKNSGQFSRVTVQSLVLRAIPTPTPADSAVPANVSSYIVEFIVVMERV